MKYTPDQLQHFIDEIRENGRSVTAWEATFVERVAEKLERTGKLTDGEVEKLDEIYAERTP